MLTDRDMLRAAERALADHLALRPATPTEREAIVTAYEDTAAANDRKAEECRAFRPEPAERGRPVDGMAASEAAKGALWAERNAAIARSHADAWRDPDAYAKTERELRARVAFYTERCAGGGVS